MLYMCRMLNLITRNHVVCGCRNQYSSTVILLRILKESSSSKSFLTRKFCMETKWYPENIYTPDIIKNKNYSILILNRKIKINPEVLKQLWQNAKIRITVDGGTNRWLSFIQKYYKNESLLQPDIISGDFDSIHQQTLDYFRNVKRIHTPDQNETDFTKALMELKPIVEDKNIDNILVIYDNSGRLDHIMANINTLFKSKRIFSDINADIRIYLICDKSMTWLLNPGTHSIKIPSILYETKSWCSLIPIGEKAIVTTNGLKWDLDNSTLQFGGMVSSSNTYSSELVKISTNTFLLWSMKINCYLDDNYDDDDYDNNDKDKYS